MKDTNHTESGSITVIALIILVILTALGIAVTDTATTDGWISRNEGIALSNFFVAEGGVRREGQEVGSSNYSVTDLYAENVLIADETGLQPSGAALPNPDNAAGEHLVRSQFYSFNVTYAGYGLPPKGYSADKQSMFNFDVDATAPNGATVDSRYYKIGPKVK